MKMDKNRLYNKYSITKTDGSPIDPSAVYFVLRLDTDPAARLASIAYARAIKPYNREFSSDLFGYIGSVVVELLVGKKYKDKIINSVNYDPEISEITDLYLMGGERVSFSTSNKAIEFVEVEEIERIASGRKDRRITEDTTE